MKITVIVPTEEVRIPSKGEYAYVKDTNVWHYCAGTWLEKWPIGKAHEVEVPEDSTALQIHYHNGITWHYLKELLLTRPKKTVKRWQWVIESGRAPMLLTSYYTEQEVRSHFLDKQYYHKIPETEKEFDV